MLLVQSRRSLARVVPSLRRLQSTWIERGGLSKVKGPTSPAVVGHTTGSILEEVCSKHGHLPAIISHHQNVTLTFSELDRLSSVVARNLAHKGGIKPGDRVAVCSGNRWEYPVLQFALGKLGAVLIPLNTAFTDKQFDSALRHADISAILTTENIIKRDRSRDRDLSGLVASAASIAKEKGVEQDIVYIIGNPDHPNSFENLLDENVSSVEFDTHQDNVINMQFTSGTTSAPKLSELTHKNVVNNGIFIGNRMGLSATQGRHPTGQDHMCIPVPMFHCFGLVLSNMAALTHGAAVVYPSESFDPEATLEAITKYKCTGVNGVPTMFAAELEIYDPAKHNLDYLSKGIAAGSPIPVEMMHKLVDVFHLTELTICYGMTETSPVSFMTTPQDPLEKRVATVGRVMPNTEAMIAEPGDDGLNPLPLNKPGEIVVSGYLVQRGYYRDPENSAQVMIKDASGKTWMRTGDEGVIDEEGYLTVTGRIKDLIIRGGENIHPLEIENMLFTHPSVSQASVVGVPDAKYGEAVAAFIIPHHGETIDPQEIKDYIREHIGPFLCPEHVFTVQDFPQTASGKIRKVDLRKQAAKFLE
jgi:acyl-CoA synthetase (AMP-forming)/AMP-acid ligase II